MSEKREQPGTDGQGDPTAEAALEARLAEARAAPPPPLPGALSERLMAQALTAMPPALSAAPGSAVAEAPRYAGWGGRWMDWLGGLPGFAGAAAAGLVGLWIGLAAPGPAGALVGAVDTVLGPDDDWPEQAGLIDGDAALWAVLGLEAEAGR